MRNSNTMGNFQTAGLFIQVRTPFYSECFPLRSAAGRGLYERSNRDAFVFGCDLRDYSQVI